MKLGEKHKKVIALLIAGDKTVEEIAESVNVSRKTIYNWQEDSDFMAEYNRQLNEINRKIGRKTAILRSKAIKRQEDILDDGGDRVAAIVARDVLNRPSEAAKPEGDKVVTIVNNIPDADTIKKGAAALLRDLNLKGDTKQLIQDELERLKL